MPLGPPKGADTPPREEEIMPLGPPPKGTPLHEERGGPSKFDSRNHDAWTPQRNRHPSTRRGGLPSKFDFRNHAAWTPQRSRHPSTRRGRGEALKIRFSKSCRLDPSKGGDIFYEEGGGGALKIRFSKSCRLDPPKEQTPLHEEREEGKPSKFTSTKHASPGRQATAKHDRDSPRRTGAAPSTTEAAPNKHGASAKHDTGRSKRDTVNFMGRQEELAAKKKTARFMVLPFPTTSRGYSVAWWSCPRQPPRLNPRRGDGL